MKSTISMEKNVMFFCKLEDLFIILCIGHMWLNERERTCGEWCQSQALRRLVVYRFLETTRNGRYLLEQISQDLEANQALAETEIVLCRLFWNICSYTYFCAAYTISWIFGTNMDNVFGRLPPLNAKISALRVSQGSRFSLLNLDFQYRKWE